MLDSTLNLNLAVFGKTAVGQQEIASRALGLPPIVRRLLILVDGKRTGQELNALVAGHVLADLLDQLLQKNCIELVKAAVGTAASPSTGLEGVPPAESRSAQELDMARNFMINTLNAAFGQHYCLTLIEAISVCQSTQALRQLYPTWLKTMGESRSSGKELPALIGKLLRVL